MKLVLVVNQKARPPRHVHVFHVLAGTVVSARSVCGHVRPEGQVRTALPATLAVEHRYNSHPEGDTICTGCSRYVGFVWTISGDAHQLFVRDPAEIKQLRW